MTRWTIAIAIAVVGSLALVGCVGADRSGDVTSEPAGPGAVEVVMHDDEFDPGRLELEAGTEVTVEVTNEGGSSHDFTIDDLDLSTGVLQDGDVASATFVVPEGTTEYRCTIHGGMNGEIVATR